jgi:hypothetical protein
MIMLLKEIAIRVIAEKEIMITVMALEFRTPLPATNTVDPTAKSYL